MIDEELIRSRAHGIWEREGCPAGRAEAHWAIATAELAAEGKRKARPATRRTAAAKAETPVKKAPGATRKTAAMPA